MTPSKGVTAEEAWKVEEAALVELSDKIIAAAVADDASDIHLDPAPKETKVRFRIDGVMHDVLTLPRKVHDPLVSRFKRLADLDTANRRAIQMGRIVVKHERHEYELRETVLPTVDGEKLTLRVMPEARIRLDQCGYSKGDRARLDKCLRSPTGLLVFSGPTGCGKTTCMHAAMLELASPERVLMSVEDPVEIRLPGVVQMSINRKLGILYPEALHGVLRADPDVVMIDEIPDHDTAAAAVDVAITGHLVMTALHADDTGSAIRRLLDLGADPFALSQALLMVSSQRLVRRICSECKQPVEHHPEAVAELVKRGQEQGMPWPGEQPTLYKGRGCERCLHMGYYGRTGVFEIMVMDDKLAELVRSAADGSEIRAAAVKQGMTTLFADGMAKAIAGETTPDEVLRVVRV